MFGTDRLSGHEMPDGSTCFTAAAQAHVASNPAHKWGDYHHFTGGPWCIACRKLWPCLWAPEHNDIAHWRHDESVEQWQSRCEALMPASVNLVSPSVNLLRMAQESYTKGDLLQAHRLSVDVWDTGGAAAPPHFWMPEHFDEWARLETARLASAQKYSLEYHEREALWRRAAKRVGLRN